MEKFANSFINAGINLYGLRQRIVRSVLEELDEAVHRPPLDEESIHELGEYDQEDLHSEYSEWEVEEELFEELPASYSNHLIANSSRGDDILRDVEFNIRNHDNGDAPQLFGMIVNFEMIDGPRINPNRERGDGFSSPEESILSQALLRNNRNIKRAKRRKKTTQTTLPNGLRRKTRFRNRSESRYRTRSRSPILKRLTPGP